eukprot:SAG25_NODE_885_length_4932_cov_8.691082_3_plen_91_part_00
MRVFSQLDYAEEYFVDSVNNELYLAINGSQVPPKQLGVVTLQNLLSIRGDGAGPGSRPTEPARNITVRGIGFRDAGYTYMNPHGNPGGGE